MHIHFVFISWHLTTFFTSFTLLYKLDITLLCFDLTVHYGNIVLWQLHTRFHIDDKDGFTFWQTDGSRFRLHFTCWLILHDNHLVNTPNMSFNNCCTGNFDITQMTGIFYTTPIIVLKIVKKTTRSVRMSKQVARQCLFHCFLVFLPPRWAWCESLLLAFLLLPLMLPFSFLAGSIQPMAILALISISVCCTRILLLEWGFPKLGDSVFWSPPPCLPCLAVLPLVCTTQPCRTKQTRS